MTSVQLAFRLLAFTGHSDLAQCPGPALLAVLDAINGGLQDFYEAVPPDYRRTTLTALLPAPRLVSVATTQDSFAVAFTPALSEAERGATVRIDGDPIDNALVDPTTLLQAWTGATGSYQATIYGDAVLPPAERIVRVVGAPVIEESRKELRPRPSAPLWNEATREVGEPQEYWTEPLAASDADPALMVLRVSPMPAVRRRLRVTVDAAPAMLTLLHLIGTPVELPVRPASEIGRLLPLCAGRLLLSPFFKAGDRRATEQAQEMAKAALRRLPANLQLPSNVCGTPLGF